MPQKEETQGGLLWRIRNFQGEKKALLFSFILSHLFKIKTKTRRGELMGLFII